MTTITTPVAVSLLTTEEHRALLRAWPAIHASREAQAADFLLYALLRGKDPRAGFTPICNPVKLANGQLAWGGFQSALLRLVNQRAVAHLTRVLPGASKERLQDLAALIGVRVQLLREQKGA